MIKTLSDYLKAHFSVASRSSQSEIIRLANLRNNTRYTEYSLLLVVTHDLCLANILYIDYTVNGAEVRKNDPCQHILDQTNIYDVVNKIRSNCSEIRYDCRETDKDFTPLSEFLTKIGMPAFPSR
jgi:hypothetical protein